MANNGLRNNNVFLDSKMINGITTKVNLCNNFANLHFNLPLLSFLGRINADFSLIFSYFSYSSTENEIFGNRFNFNIFKRITRSHLVVILEDVDGRKFPFTLDSELGYYTSEKCDEKIYKDDDYYYIHTMDNLIYRCKEEAMVDKITFPNGDEIEFYEYDAWGKLINPTTYINTILYKGYYYDVETGYFWLSSRYYSPELCRFISPDDVEYLEPESVN